ncbi:hypothetical protein GCM10023346_21270 [Arthrobacter gyeryongensis]|uniref:FHA domain-containing protein n=1 Tax=Arthrobacter gyeryongensis TaxID=1650592 RepID=A0ABP9SED4_9MICC
MIVVVEKVTSPALITEIWDLLSTHPTVDDVFVALTASFDQPIHRMPSFGVVAFAKELHAILRGPLRLATAPGPDSCLISGNEGNRWSERMVPQQDFTLSSDEEPPEATQEAWLPVHEAVIAVGGLHVSFVSAARPAAPASNPAQGPYSAPVAVDGSGATLMSPPETAPEEALADGSGATLMSPPETAPDETLTEAPMSAVPVKENGAKESEHGSPEDEGYDYLWGHTIIRTVEDAAVREAEDDAEPDQLPPARPSTPEGEPVVPPFGSTPASPPAPATDLSPAPVTGFGHRSTSPEIPANGLIDAVPWARETETAPPPVTTDKYAVDPETYDDDVEHTVIVPRTRSGAPDADRQPELASDAKASITVLGRICGNGHANPPQQSDCSVCGGSLTGEPHDVPRPSLGRVRLSTGDVIELDRPLVVGRKPAVSRVQGTDMPRLISVSKDRTEVSRSHIEVTLEGWHVLLRDLRSSNGTVLTRDGQRPRRLDQGEVTMLVTGDVIELGGAVSLLFEELR